MTTQSRQPNRSPTDPDAPAVGEFRDKIHEIIFGADTPAGIWFDIALLIAILISVVCVCLNTVDSISARWNDVFTRIEWTLTVLFTIEYVLRLYCVRRPWRYATSFFGIVDLLAVVPSYLQLFFPGYHTFAVVRALRLLRVFRILKLAWFVHESDDLARAVYQARAKIVVFLSVIMIAITIAGSLMYEIENPESLRDAMAEVNHLSQLAVDSGYSLDPNDVQFDLLAQELGVSHEDLELRLNELATTIDQPIDKVVSGDLVASEFSSIPQAMYWATVTMTTVGYGDIVPHTPIGKIVSAILILLGYSLIIVPTGFVSAEIISHRKEVSNITCRYCMTSGHDADAKFCKHCGEAMTG